MVTDKVYHYLSDQAYEVDRGKNSTPWATGDELHLAEIDYRIIDASDNHTNDIEVLAMILGEVC